jgi:chromosome segregation ATPase
MLKNNDITPQYLNDLFENSLRKVIKELEKEVGKSLELYYGVIHYDEKTPHLHFAIQNRTKDNKSVFNIIRKKETLSKFQDLVGEEFKQIGFNRGIKKEFTNAKHLNVTQMHQKEIEQLQQTIKELQQQKKDINDEINDILSLLKNVENDKKEDIKKLEQKIKELKNLRKQLILDIKEEKMTLKKLKLSIKNRVNKSIENHTTMGVLTNKDGLKKDIEKIVIDSLKIDVDLEKTELNNILLQQTIKEKEREIEIKDDVIKDFENTINNLQNENHTLKENTKNTTKLQKENVEQFNKIQMLKSELKDLKEENKTLKPSQTLFKRETEKREKEREISKLKDEKIEQLQQQKENVENIVSELKYELNDVKKEMKNYKEFVKSRKSEYEQFLQNRKNKNKNIGRR